MIKINNLEEILHEKLLQKQKEVFELQHEICDYEERCRKIKDYLKLIREDNQKGMLCSYNLIEDNITRLCDGLDILGSDKE